MFIWVHSISYSCIQIHTHYGSEHTVAYIAQAPIDQGVKKFVETARHLVFSSDSQQWQASSFSNDKCAFMV